MAWAWLSGSDSRALGHIQFPSSPFFLVNALAQAMQTGMKQAGTLSEDDGMVCGTCQCTSGCVGVAQ